MFPAREKERGSECMCCFSLIYDWKGRMRESVSKRRLKRLLLLSDTSKLREKKLKLCQWLIFLFFSFNWFNKLINLPFFFRICNVNRIIKIIIMSCIILYSVLYLYLLIHGHTRVHIRNKDSAARRGRSLLTRCESAMVVTRLHFEKKKMIFCKILRYIVYINNINLFLN